MNIDLTGKVALVTGASAGIGRVICNTLAAAGAKVAINYLSNHEAALEAVHAIKESGGEAAAFKADASDLAQISAMMIKIEQTYGAVDILVNNAGGLVKRVPNAEMDEAHYHKVMDINFKSTVFMSKAVTAGMKAKGKGKIVNVVSLAAHDGGGPGATIYAASKGAALTYTKGLAKELAAHHINVNAVSPGFIGQTAFHATFTSDEGRKATINKIPLGREGAPQDVANTVLFLASELADYLTGESIEINGGLFMR